MASLRSVPVGAAAALVLAVALLPAAGCHRTPRARNLVIISLDTTRADHLGCYGMKGGVTPAIDTLAAGGALLAHTTTPVPMTLPAHSSLLTGMIPPVTGVHDNFNYRLRDSAETLAEVLQGKGWQTAGFVSAFVLDHRFGLSQGFGTWDDHFDNPVRTDFGTERRGSETVDHAIRWLDSHGGKPFFIFLHLYDPHEPYDPPAPWASKFADDPYTGEIAYADQQVGRFLGALKAHGLDATTLIVLVGDHGEELGQHGEDTHSYFVYQPALHVPCIFHGPGIPPGTRLDGPTGLIDVVPTVCDLLDVPAPATVQGHDLANALRGKNALEADRTLYFESLTPTRYGANPLLGEIDGRWKYIRTTRSELYDLPTDPGETANLLAGRRDTVRRLQRALNADTRLASLAATASHTATDREAAAKLQSLGYLASDVEDTLAIEPGRPDPKDLIEVHEANQRAIRMISEGNYLEAEKATRLVLDRLPDFYEAWMNLGRIAFAQQDWKAAIPYLEKALKLKPDLYAALYDLGVAYTETGKLSEATEAFRRAVDYDPQPPSAHLNLARALVNEKQWDEAAKELETVLKLRPGEPAAVNMLAEAAAHTGHLAQAIPHLQRAVKQHPGDVPTRFNLVQALLAVGRTGDAMAQLRQLTGDGADPAMLRRARALLEQAGHPELAGELAGGAP
ncbi:MAG: tetratricopeptide repeat protein, partial [Acidobacteria bacterium]|nr:tetratricopeptide repeat protein [Acidobacteriota bacterium]